MEHIHNQTPPVIDLAGALPRPGSQEEATPRRPRLFDERGHTYRALAAARRKAFRVPTYQLDRQRYIIFSDLHRGDRRTGADEFLPNEATYCRALAHYLERDYRLILNGDVEEGWQADYPAIVEAYADTVYALERAFARRGEGYYLRTWGNHDVEWSDPAQVRRHLGPVMGDGARAHAAILLGDRLLITHGHQGEWHSDRFAWVSRRVVRHIWTPLQHRLGFSIERTAENAPRARQRDHLLTDWARAQRLLVIAGHTHRPLLHTTPDETAPLPLHYVNGGCCVHTDGITGLEIDRGEARLVRWSRTGTDGVGRRVVFARVDLAAALARL